MKWKSIVAVTLIACLLGIQPVSSPAQAAEGDVEEQRVDTEKLWNYAMCGASIALASGTGAWVLAFITCHSTVLMEYPRPRRRPWP